MGVINNSAVSTHRARPTTTKMKALLVIALASLAAAKPQLPLYPYTYPLTYTVPVVTPVAVNTCKNSEGQLVPCASGAGSVYAHADAPGVPIVPGVLNTAGGVSPVLSTGEEAVKVEKRDAEADPSALWYGYYGRPWGYYQGYYGFYGHPFYGYRSGGTSNQMVENAGASYEVNVKHKREAEADPSAYWYGYYGHPYHWGYYGYYGYYGHPYYGYYGGCRNNQGALVPCAGK